MMEATPPQSWVEAVACRVSMNRLTYCDGLNEKRSYEAMSGDKSSYDARSNGERSRGEKSNEMSNDKSIGDKISNYVKLINAVKPCKVNL